MFWDKMNILEKRIDFLFIYLFFKCEEDERETTSEKGVHERVAACERFFLTLKAKTLDK